MRYNMRPHSAKPGRVAHVNVEELQLDSDMSSRDQLYLPNNQHQQRSRVGRLSGNEYARIIPNNFYHDNEQLYSEAIKLKQRTNATLDENVKLKTRIAMLEKQKGKLMRFIEQEAVKVRSHTRTGTQPSSDLNNSGAGRERESKLASMQRLLNDAKESIEVLKAENTQIKKSVKYSKLSEAQVENRMILEESGRLRRLAEDLQAQLQEHREMGSRESQLQKELKQLYKQNEELYKHTKSYQEDIELLEDKLKETEQRCIQRERKANRQLSDCKKRLAEAVLECQTLRREVQSNRNHCESHSSNGHGRSEHSNFSDFELKKMIEEINRLRIKNNELEKQINGRQSAHSSVSGVNAGGSNQFKGRRPQTSKTVSSKNKQHTAQSFEAQELKRKEELSDNIGTGDAIEPIEYRNTRKKTAQQPINSGYRKAKALQIEIKKKQPQTQPAENIYSKVQKIESPKKEEKTSSPQKSANSKRSSIKQPSQHQLEQRLGNLAIGSIAISSNKQNEDEYFDEFEQPPSDRHGIYNFAESKTIENREHDAEKTRRARLREVNGIKQLLTYRMKAQRYMFSQLRKDILQSGKISFQLNELAETLSDLPFYLDNDQIETVLCFIFDTNNLRDDMVVSTESFLSKLRQLIDDFHLISSQEEKETMTNIVSLVDANTDFLLAELEKRSNGRGSISQEELEIVLGNLQLPRQSIELVVAEIALSSASMSSLNYSALFKIFSSLRNDHMSEVEQQDEQSGDSGLLRQKKKRPELGSPSGSDESYIAQSFSMRAGCKEPVDYEVLSDQDIQI